MIEPFRGDEFGDDRDIQGQAKNDLKVAGVANKKGVNKGDSFSFIILYPLAIREEFSMVVDKELLLVSEKSMNIGGEKSPPMVFTGFYAFNSTYSLTSSSILSLRRNFISPSSK
jgi:hypothetical protein